MPQRDTTAADVLPDGDDVDVTATTEGVRLSVGETSTTLSRDAVRQLRSALGTALSEGREFVHTAGHHRADGTYVVERRGADSTGHRKVFDSFAACRDLFDSLPTTFVATDLDAPGVSGGRRHMLAWHFVEHPAFDCSLDGRQPLTVTKADDRTLAEDPAAADGENAEVVGD